MFLIQVWHGDKIGSWHNTNFGGEDREKVLETAQKISLKYKVRVLEQIFESKEDFPDNSRKRSNLELKTFSDRSKIDEKSAKGTKGVLCFSPLGDPFFRVCTNSFETDIDKEDFIDYDIFIGDCAMEIIDNDAVLRDDGKLDHSKKCLGYE